MDKLAALLKTAGMSMPEDSMMAEGESPSLSMHLESMKPIIDSASVEAIMQFVEDLISYKLSPNGEED